MAASLWTCALGFLIVSGPVGGDQATAAQASAPVSLERVRAGLQKPPTIEIDATALLPVATFRTAVDQPRFVLTFEEWLRGEFEMTDLQRQSAEWGSKCCGLSLGTILEPIGRALRDHKQQKIRERIARELEAVKAAGGR